MRRALARQGTSLSSCEDTDLAICAVYQGLGFGVLGDPFNSKRAADRGISSPTCRIYGGLGDHSREFLGKKTIAACTRTSLDDPSVRLEACQVWEANSALLLGATEWHPLRPSDARQK
jgi:hypothetical protein